MSVRILTGDALERLRELPDASVDVVITDPPYGETSLAWDRWPRGWPALLPRLLKPHGSMWCFGSLRMFMDRAAEFADWQLAQDVVWEKHNGSNAFDDRFRRVHEYAAHFYPRGRPWAEIHKSPLYSADATARTVRRKARPQQWGEIGGAFYESHDGGPRMLRSVWCHRSEHGRADHPTQKPVGIVAPLVTYSCPPGGAILDPFAGSGTIGIAANAAGRDAILIELNPAYVEIARARIQGDAPMFVTVAAE